MRDTGVLLADDRLLSGMEWDPWLGLATIAIFGVGAAGLAMLLDVVRRRRSRAALGAPTDDAGGSDSDVQEHGTPA